LKIPGLFSAKTIFLFSIIIGYIPFILDEKQNKKPNKNAFVQKKKKTSIISLKKKRKFHVYLKRSLKLLYLNVIV